MDCLEGVRSKGQVPGGEYVFIGDYLSREYRDFRARLG
jgi:hypothetical protein